MVELNQKIVDLSSYNETAVSLVFKENADVLFIHPHNKKVMIDINENCDVHFALFLNDNDLDYQLIVNVNKMSNISIHCADFGSGKISSTITINLNAENSIVYWHLASLSKDRDFKQHNVSVFHNVPNTFAKVDNYGVSKDSSRLSFLGISHILKGSFSSKTFQNSKIMVFDPSSIAVAKPILKIDENDVEASHAAVVGKINDEHLFYLTSRGLNEDEAKALITMGYLKPILDGFNKDYQNQIESIIERRI